MLALDGDAAIHVHSLPNFRTLTQGELILALEDRFGAALTITKDKRLLRSRTKTRDESY